ncbi:T9SS type A sorting domain-containing protein [Pseudobacter ginsenosidimutans]|uniref:Putative secreted protein (Por secretion system target) n=1 Tax=Pseudobacter ginsenosidimutans TaxID=661488 RepID=A0A4Q7MFT6_9BACT|nr:T9SS type A sorting domain-containing protein [Pseudobacter ginsenosidimutans]QEC45510.1 T9SS type A sorting domain-containing protein [Pseudobacter ginsenosidimutans]RZS67046.1 putative secreted protein (Por secretion system target) [Pseudobacter ginsenosidimutans]
MNILRTVFTSVLTAAMLCVTGSAVYAQAVVKKVVPASTTYSSSLTGPNGTANHRYLRSHFLLLASEIGLPAGTVIHSIGFRYAGGSDAPAAGSIKLYLENSSHLVNARSTLWSTAITGMTNAYTGTFNPPVGVMDEAVVSLELQTPFTYNGGSLYIGYDYTGTGFATIDARMHVNDDQGSSTAVRYSYSASAVPATLDASFNWRPQMELGYANAELNDLEVRQIKMQSILGKFWATQNPVTVIVRNNSNQTRNNINVTMNVSGINSTTATDLIAAIAAGDSAEVTFEAPVANQGSQTITISIPGDNDNTNNTCSRIQTLDCSSFQYASNENDSDSMGLPSTGGIMAVKITVPSISIKIDAINFRVSRDPNMNGHTVSAVILDDYGNIVANSDPFTLTDAMMGTDQVIPLLAPAYFNPGENFYAGILQESGAIYPVATARPAGSPSGINYIFDASGGIGTEDTDRGIYLIGIKTSSFLEFTSSVYERIMDGTLAMFVATPGFSHYNFKVNGESKYAGTDNYFTYFPANGDVVTLDVEINGCTETAGEVYTIDVVPITPGSGNILYVNQHSVSTGDGSSWSTPMADLSDALRWAKARQSNFTSANPLKIFVAGGTYKPMYSAVDETFGMDGGPSNAFLMVKNVQIYGGFAGYESSPDQRDLSLTANKTILSGDYSDDDYISGDGLSLTMNNMMENAFHIVVAAGDVGNAVLDGFTIRGGGGELYGMPWEVINGNQLMVQYGGGIYIHASSPRINNVIIAGNKADMFGGGIYLSHSSAAITNTLIYKNYAGISGGGIYNDINSDVYHTNLTITNNRALTSGSAMANSAATVHLRNSILYGNGSGIDNHNSTLDASYSLVQGMPADAAKHILSGSTDPLFNDVSGDDYTLRSVSGLINKGNNLYFQAGQSPDLSAITKDLNGKTRIGEGVIDIGAYEAKPTLEILQHPGSVTSCQETEVNFFVIVNSSGSTNPSYQWQQSTDGNNWTDINNATQSSYLVKATSNKQFRCIVGIPGFSVTSNAATLTTTVFERPVINIPDEICLSENAVELKASPAGGVFEGSGVTENSWNLLGFKSGKQTISYTYTSDNGCIGHVEKTINLISCKSDGPVKLFQSNPNPATSIITVKVDVGREIRDAELIISSLNGQWVVRKPVTLYRGMNVHEFNISGLGAGMYFISIYNESKKPLATIRLIRK